MTRPRIFLVGYWVAFLVASLASGTSGLGLHRSATLRPSIRVAPNPTGSTVIVAQEAPDEGSYQVPVKEGEELPDSPKADEARGEAESQMPAVEQPPSGAEVPGADQPPEVPQPGATP